MNTEFEFELHLFIGYRKPGEKRPPSAILRRKVEMPFTPFVELKLFLDCLYMDEDDEMKYSELFDKVSHPHSLFRLESVKYDVDSDTMWAYASDYEETTEGLQARIEFLGLHGLECIQYCPPDEPNTAGKREHG